MASVKQDVRAAKRQIVGNAMVPELKPEEVKAFWGVYDRYDQEMSGLFARHLDLVRRYAAAYEQPKAAQFEPLMDELFTVEAAKVQLRRRYFGEFAKALSPRAAARFTMVDLRTDRLIEAQIAGEVPLVSAK
jgi:hypothetical protein